eukprot:m.90239 g.90239  ORF g.90239 m.90239 type:complete len:777 (+) comp36642_c0_seq5:287-2617(+)
MASALLKASRKVGRIGKDAFKFRFTVTFESIELTLSNWKAWRPSSLSVRWYRGARVIQSEPAVTKEPTKSSNDLRAVWEPEVDGSLLVTLYKDNKKALFDGKTYKFQIENKDRDGKNKVLAVFQMDMSEYAPETISKEVSRQSLSMSCQATSVKVKAATLNIVLQCEFMKQGKAGDEDMMSTFSAVQMDNVHDFEEDEEVERSSTSPAPGSPLPTKSNSSEDVGKKESTRVQDWIDKDLSVSAADPLAVSANVVDPKDVLESLFLSSHFRDAKGKLADGHPRLRDTSVIGLYFSAKWCPPCQAFIPKLKKFYEAVRRGGGSLEILYVSSDHSAEEMIRYTDEMKMPWLSIDYEDCVCDQLRNTFKIEDLPCFLLVDSQGKKLEADGKALIEVATNDGVELVIFEKLVKAAAASFTGCKPSQKPSGPSPKESTTDSDKDKDGVAEEQSKPIAEASDETQKKGIGSAVKNFFSFKGKGKAEKKSVSDVENDEVKAPESPSLQRSEDKPSPIQERKESERKGTTSEALAQPEETPKVNADGESESKKDMKSPTKKGFAGVFQLFKGKKSEQKKRVFSKEAASLEGPLSPGTVEAETKESELSAQHAHSHREKAGKKDRMKQLEAENTKLKKEVVELREDLEELQTQVEQLRKKLSETEVKASQERDMVEARLTLKGWLMKRGIKGPTANVWRRRWFSLDSSGRRLHYYKGSSNEGTPQGFIELDMVEGVEEQSATKQDKNGASFNVITTERTYELLAHDEKMMRKWISAMETVRNSKTA